VAAPVRTGLVVALLVAAQFVVRPHLGDPRYAPDFVLVALLVFAIRARPMAGTIAGFLVGLAADALAPTAFGASAFALTIVGYGAGWLKAVVFADNVLVTGLFVLLAAWLRDVVQVIVGHLLQGGALAWQLLALSPLMALTTAAAAVLTLAAFRSFLRPGGA
jgi:rod shape-determining protein MreD